MVKPSIERAISDEERARYQRDGFVVVKGLLPQIDVIDLLCGIDRLLCTKLPEAIPSRAEDVMGEIHGKILALAQIDRAALGRVYDGMRKLTSFWKLSAAVSDAFQDLTGATSPGIVFRGSGIRLDLPGEDRHRSQWHQEYHSQMSSLHGATAWFSLVPVSLDMGPVEFLRGSHTGGLQTVRCIDPLNRGRDYTQTFFLAHEEELVRSYPHVQVETDASDVVFLHFLTIHQSGWNRSGSRSRVTCQVRLFDMADPLSVAQNWVGGWQDGVDFTALHPDKVLQ